MEKWWTLCGFIKLNKADMKKAFVGSIVSILLGAGIIDLYGFSVVGLFLIMLGCLCALFSGAGILARTIN